ncbi:hypothetical protein POM88_040150 [Heracleum sosnowskyi]|uniref:Uncharacterized protein n=1 Tax=Heracleum sosnowskyi TaxID=360622 RepID=A0AAD8HDZ5_9APIA|nr:hypothetical protein POM88_040150 [Heracleum sosnowskyi]
MENVKVMGNNLCGGLDRAVPKIVTTMYPSFTKLSLCSLPKLEEGVEAHFSTDGTYQCVFLKLEMMDIMYCPRLRKIPNSCFPSLKRLDIMNLESNMVLENVSRKVFSLEHLQLMNISFGGGSSSS